jgi:hypothetical protein
MNLLNASLLVTLVTIALAQGWVKAVVEWIGSKVSSTQVGQTAT